MLPLNCDIWWRQSLCHFAGDLCFLRVTEVASKLVTPASFETRLYGAFLCVLTVRAVKLQPRAAYTSILGRDAMKSQNRLFYPSQWCSTCAGPSYSGQLELVLMHCRSCPRHSFEIRTALGWVVTPCSLLNRHQRFGEIYCLHPRGILLDILFPFSG
jgi:hypothetical protein